jgi:ABC-type spermidine/putrescine transport system permease subunit I
MKAALRRGGYLLAASPPVALVALFIGVPIAVTVIYTLGHLGGPNAAVSSIALHQVSAGDRLLTFGAYREVFDEPNFRADLVATVWVTAASVGIVLLLAWTIALFARLSGRRVAGILTSLAVVPLFIPVVIGSYAILQFWSYGGFMKTIAHAVGLSGFPALGFTLGGVVLAEVWVSLPFAVLMISSGLQAVPDSVFEAARDAGASTLQAAWSILLPMNLLPTIIATCFTGISILGSFTVPYLVGPTSPNLLGPLATETFQSFNQPQQAEVMSMVIFGLAIVVALPYLWATYRSNRDTAAS